MIDGYGRNIDYMRISITDRCNLRCIYCMPDEGVLNYSHSDILTYDEIAVICRAAASLSIDKVRITGGEPLVRKGSLQLVSLLKSLGLEVSLTTNGVLLEQYADGLYDAGLDNINISLDTLNEETFLRICRKPGLSQVLHGIRMALDRNMKVKLNTVPIRGINDSELCRIALMAKDDPISVRFIELMPIGLGKHFRTVSSDEMLSLFNENFGHLNKIGEKLGNGPAVYYRPDGFAGNIGFIGALSHSFCNNCNRIRLTADGKLKLCLHYDIGTDLKTPLRKGASEKDIAGLICEAVKNKPASHRFGSETDTDYFEKKNMSQIGG